MSLLERQLELWAVHERTLRGWEAEGKIQAIRTPSGQRRYDITTYAAQFVSEQVDICYARVSSRAQQGDLERQVAFLRSRYPHAQIVSEIGGGLNFKRPKLLAVLGRILQGSVKRLIVAHKDRLARFGIDLFRWLCEQNGCELVVLNEADLSPEREMVEDILAILHGFSSRLYGLRKYKAQIQEDPDLPLSRAKQDLASVDRGLPLLLQPGHCPSAQQPQSGEA